MVSNNSQCDIYVAVLCGIYHDLVSVLIPKREVLRDLREIRDRSAAEGIGFLTKTLPSLGKAIDRSLASGDILQFRSFKRRKGTKLPAFAGGLLRILFSEEGLPIPAKGRKLQGCEASLSPVMETTGSNSGGLCVETQVKALKALRQICYLVYKLNIPYHEAQEKKVIDDFVKTDKNLPNIRVRNLEGPTWVIAKKARELICRVLANADPKSGVPRHGSGAVATGEKSHEKHEFKRFISRLNTEYPIEEWFYLNRSHLWEDLRQGKRYFVHKRGEAAVVLVPKDSRGPRLISKEPLENQWIQQAQMQVLVDCIESHPLTRGRVNFTHQEVNRRLALEGSQGSFPWATLDMKEASDRVGLRLVYSLFPKHWFAPLYASRSSHTRLPDGTRVRLKKFAPMGSAVCFPVEALVFWALSVSALIIHKHMQLREAAANVFVYGDDIIVRSEDHGLIIQSLEAFGLLVNRDKCCTAGPFKESCGMDAFHGIPVTPLRLRKPWSSSLSPSVLVSWVAFSNAAWADKMHVTALTVEGYVQALWRGRIPVISHQNPAVCCFIRPELHVPLESQPNVRKRFNKHFQRMEVQGLALIPTSRKTKVTGYPLLLRYLTVLERKRTVDSPVLVNTEKGGRRIPTGYFAIAHREKPTRAWTPV